MHLTIRADGGPNIGYGHLARTGALAEYALDAGDRVTYATLTPENAQEVCPNKINLVELDPENEHSDFLEWITDTQPDAVLTDSYEINTERQQSITKHVPHLSVVFDDARFTIHADVLINGNIHAPSLDYEWFGSEPEWYLGTDYLLLRKEIEELSAGDPPFRETPKRALITMGGSDVRSTTPQIVRAFDGTDLRVDVIVGPGFQNRAEIDQAAVETTGEFDVVRNPQDLPKRMFNADLAVSATGDMIYELLALGTPTIGLPQADNQKPVANALGDQGTIATVDIRVSKIIKSLINDSKRRRAMRRQGRELINGRGVERVYEAVAGRSS